MSWVSKELKKSFITHKLDEINQNITKSIQTVQIIFLVALLDAYFNDKKVLIGLILVGILLF